MDQNNRNNRNRGDKNRRRGGGMWSIVLWALLLTIGVNYVSVMLEQARAAESSCEIAHSELVDLVESGKVKSIEIGDDVYTITPVDGFVYTDDDGKSYDQDYTLFTTIIPAMSESLLSLCDEEGVTYTKPYEAPISPVLAFMVTYILPTVLMVGAFMLLMNIVAKKSGGMGGIGGIGSVGKANAKVYMEKSTGVTFADVAGQDEAKESLVEIIDFLHNPEKYTAIGAKIPKGALLVGSPGTGKTLLAKAVAGEAGVPFFSISGSDFVEMFVGVGASRVRDLFKEAKSQAPSIIFIDEIDAVGRARSKNPAMGGNDERENTLNALLTEMDGFGTNSGVIILAATNRVDMLDSALLRAGRFDREIHVDLPGLNERKAIFLVHLKPIKIDDTVDVDLLARQTPGFSGADIANVCNEAALIAARHDKKAVCKQDFLDAVDRIVGGLEKKTKVMTADEKRSIALHEAGHATISWFCQYANPLIKVTIVPRGQALGAAWYLPEERQITTKEQMLDEMCSLMGGRAAEELFTGHISSGAMNDLERATKSAYGMVAYLGMSKTLPNICYYNQNEYSFQRPYSETTAREIDKEVLQMVNEQYTRAKNILMEHKEGHNALAELLIQKEVIMAEDVEHIFGKRPWLSRSQEIMEDEQPKIDDAVKDMPEVQAAIKEHEEAKKASKEEAEENTSEKAPEKVSVDTEEKGSEKTSDDASEKGYEKTSGNKKNNE